MARTLYHPDWNRTHQPIVSQANQWAAESQEDYRQDYQMGTGNPLRNWIRRLGAGLRTGVRGFFGHDPLEGDLSWLRQGNTTGSTVNPAQVPDYNAIGKSVQPSAYDQIPEGTWRIGRGPPDRTPLTRAVPGATVGAVRPYGQTAPGTALPGPRRFSTGMTPAPDTDGSWRPTSGLPYGGARGVPQRPRKRLRNYLR